MKRFFLLAGLGAIFTSANAQLSPVINEFVFNHVGTDTNEFLEIFGEANFSLSNFQVIGIEGDSATSGTGIGTVDNVLTLGTTDAGGFWTTGYASNLFENGSLTLLLVTGFTGAVGNDLDTDNNGVLDSTPWTTIIDSVAVFDGGATDFTFSSVVLAPGFSGSAFTPGGASRIPNGLDTNAVSDWVVNDFDNAGIPGFTGTPDVNEAYNTMGAVNQPVPEPATLAALGLGAIALIRRKRK